MPEIDVCCEAAKAPGIPHIKVYVTVGKTQRLRAVGAPPLPSTSHHASSQLIRACDVTAAKAVQKGMTTSERLSLQDRG